MILRGISYVNDANGQPTRALIDLTFYRDEFQQFLRLAAAKPGAVVQPTAPSPNAGGKADTIIAAARTFLGTRHVIGGNDRNGIDCSGLTSAAYQAVGLGLPRVSRAQADVGTPVERTGLRKGDLVFFATGTPGRINHVGIVSESLPGDTQFIHASTSKGVIESRLSENYWNAAYMTGRRVV